MDRIAAIREIVGDDTIAALAELFELSDGSPLGIPADRYRADHSDLIDLLDRLESAQLFLRRQQDSPSKYQVTLFALPLLESDRSRRYLETMEALYAAMRGFYREKLTEPVTVAELIERAKADTAMPLTDVKDIKDALLCMVDGASVWSGRSQGFPY